MQYIFIIIGLILAAIGAFGWLRGKKLENQTVEEIESKRKQQIQKDLYKHDFELTEFKMYAKQEVSRLQVEISQANLDRQEAIQRAAEAQEATNKILASEQGRAAAELQRFKELEQVKIEQENQKKIQSLNLLYEKQQQDLEKIFNEYKKMYSDELEEYETQLKEFRSISESVNQAILRQKELKDQEDFYSLQVPQNDRDDIKVLQSMDLKLHNRDVIPKLIWDLFVRRPAQEMIKRVTAGRDISGIYKITYKETGESYIGKTTSISTRWQNHLKTAIGLDAAARSTLHTRMAADGIWNYTFEILEEVPKDQLSAREAFYIDLYGTKQQLNMKSGDKK